MRLYSQIFIESTVAIQSLVSQCIYAIYFTYYIEVQKGNLPTRSLKKELLSCGSLTSNLMIFIELVNLLANETMYLVQ